MADRGDEGAQPGGARRRRCRSHRHDAGHRPTPRGCRSRRCRGCSTTPPRRCRSPPSPVSGCSRPPTGSAIARTRWPAGSAAPRRCCSGSSSGRSPTRSSPRPSRRSRCGPGNVATTSCSAAPTARPTRRSSCTPSSRPATATASSCSATCATSRACSTTSARPRCPSSPCGQGSALAGIDTVNVDNRAGVAMGIDHLHALGHRRIGFIGESPHGDVREREAAFVERLTELGVRRRRGPHRPRRDRSRRRRRRLPPPVQRRRTRRPRWSRRPTTSRSACSTPPTACGWRSPSRCRSSGSTTSRSPRSPPRR